MANKTKTVEVGAKQYEDYDDCLAAAVADYAREHHVRASRCSAEWTDNERDTITITVQS